MGGSYEQMGGSMSYGGWCSKSDYNEFKEEWTSPKRLNFNPNEGPKHITCSSHIWDLFYNPLFTFGKYKGYDINSVNEFDPEYIKWISLWITEKKYGKILYDSIKKRI